MSKPSRPPVLSVKNLSKRFARSKTAAVANICLELGKGELLALLGESGSGKTTLLRMIAGFERPTSGRILIENTPVCDGTLYLEPEQRRVSLVFQESALFPHLTVLENICFGLHRHSRAERNARARSLLELVGLAGYGSRYPHEISGGEAQRVALARALGPHPSLLLLDEPFNNLDMILKHRLIEEVREIIRRADTTAIFVTHERHEAFSLADRLAILWKGKLQQLDTPSNIYKNPVNPYVAHFLGKTNLIPARITAGGYHTALGTVNSCAPLQDGKKSYVSIRPNCLNLVKLSHSPRHPNPQGAGYLQGLVKRVTFHGEYQEVILEVGLNGSSVRQLLAHVDVEANHRPGEMVSIAVKAHCWLHRSVIPGRDRY